MIIKSYNRLDKNTISDIRLLEEKCMKKNGIDRVYLDDSLHFDHQIRHTFIACEKGEPVSFLHLFIPTPNEAELSAITLPEQRGMGYFSALLACALQELEHYHIPDLLFVTRPSAADPELMRHLGACYDFSEYVMMLEKSEWQGPDAYQEIRLVRAEWKNLDALVRISVAAFGDSGEDARSMAEKSLLSGSREGFAAEYNEKLIGMAYVNYEEEAPCIFGFAIDPEFQGRRLGTHFLNRIIEHVFSKGVSAIKLEVDSKNDHALHVYQRLGFSVVSGYDYYRSRVKPWYDGGQQKR